MKQLEAAGAILIEKCDGAWVVSGSAVISRGVVPTLVVAADSARSSSRSFSATDGSVTASPRSLRALL